MNSTAKVLSFRKKFMKMYCLPQSVQIGSLRY